MMDWSETGPNRFRLLEHTADMGFEAQAESLAELFRQSALALRQIITACDAVQSGEEWPVVVSGADLPELLVNWLSELVYLLESRQQLPADCRIESVDCWQLRAVARGEIFDPQRHYLEREIKAITYHQICVEPFCGGWRAQVYVDL